MLANNLKTFVGNTASTFVLLVLLILTACTTANPDNALNMKKADQTLIFGKLNLYPIDFKFPLLKGRVLDKDTHPCMVKIIDSNNAIVVTNTNKNGLFVAPVAPGNGKIVSASCDKKNTESLRIRIYPINAPYSTGKQTGSIYYIGDIRLVPL